MKGNLHRKQPGRQSAFLCWMLAHQLLTHLQKDKKIGVGVHRTATKPFLFLCCIVYLII